MTDERHKDAHVVHDRRRRGDEDDAASTQAPNEIERLKQEVKRANDQYLRAQAEFDNTKKRLGRERDEFSKYAAETVLRDLLPIIDSLDHALVAVDPSTPLRLASLAQDRSGLRQQPDMEAIVQGVQLIHKQLLALLEKEGVKRIATLGEAFDPHRHEAVAQVEARDGQADGTVVEEVQVGYTMHGKVIRPAMVKVAKQQQSAIGNQQSAKKEESESSEGGR